MDPVRRPMLRAVLLGSVLIAIGLLAVFDIIPAAVAQYTPLAVVPFVRAGQKPCRLARKGQHA